MELEKLKLTDKRKEICERLNLNNSDDILSYYPFRYEEYNIVPYSEFKVGSQVCFTGELVSYPSTFRRGKLSTTRFKVLYEEEKLKISYNCACKSQDNKKLRNKMLKPKNSMK